MDRKSKQVLVIRKDLNMRKGKIASQAAHAATKILLEEMHKEIRYHRSEDPNLDYDELTLTLTCRRGRALFDWIEGIFTKITVSVNSEDELLAVHAKAKEVGLLTSLIQDAGLTEFGGVPTYTAVAVGPAWSEEIDPITGHLPLL
jgi:PTH2 family peptidyl-tRNA hydrolase